MTYVFGIILACTILVFLFLSGAYTFGIFINYIFNISLIGSYIIGGILLWFFSILAFFMIISDEVEEVKRDKIPDED